MSLSRLAIKDTVFLFTDGAYSNKSKRGGWGYTAVWNNVELTGWGGEKDTTNNRQELTAILRGLEAVPVSRHPIVLVSDSQYCLNSIFKWGAVWKSNGWRTALGVPVQNKALLQKIMTEVDYRYAENQVLVYRWVKGHAGNYLNELSDSLATLGQTSKGQKRYRHKIVPDAYLEAISRILGQ